MGRKLLYKAVWWNDRLPIIGTFGVGLKPKTEQEIAGMINFFQGIYKVLLQMGQGGYMPAYSQSFFWPCLFLHIVSILG